jgi:hypothetical protein
MNTIYEYYDYSPEMESSLQRAIREGTFLVADQHIYTIIAYERKGNKLEVVLERSR